MRCCWSSRYPTCGVWAFLGNVQQSTAGNHQASWTQQAHPCVLGQGASHVAEEQAVHKQPRHNCAAQGALQDAAALCLSSATSQPPQDQARSHQG